MRVLGIAVAAVIATSAYGQCTPEPLPFPNPPAKIQLLSTYQGALLAGGPAGPGFLNLAWWNGASWIRFGSGPGGNVDDAIEYGGALYVCGSMTGKVRRWNGAAWESRTTSMTSPSGGTSVAMFANFRGDLVIGGKFTTVDGQTVNNVARWDGAAWRPLGAGTNNDVICLKVLNDRLYAGGYFTAADGRDAGFIAQWDGTAWMPVGAGFDGAVFSLGEYDGELIAGGQFQHSGTAGMSLIARFDGAAWRDIGGGLAHVTLPYAGVTTAIAEYRGQLLAAGNFTAAGGAPARSMARWTGSQWIEVPGFGSFPWSIGIVNGEIFAAGYSATLKRFACPPCVADLNQDGDVDFGDYLGFINLYDAGDPAADLNQDGVVDSADWALFFDAYAAGC